MAKFTRTAYAIGPLRDLAKDIAYQAHLDGELRSHFGDLFDRKGAGRKRVRITILVEPVAAPPKRPRGPARKRPVQVALPLDDAPASPELSRALDGLLKGTKYRMPLHGADGGAT